MKFFVLKPKRKKNGKIRVGRLYRGRYRLEEDSKSIEVPLKVTDKQVALSKMERLVREAQQERYGIIPPRGLTAALATPLAIHLKEFIAELQKLGRDERYVEQRKSALPVCSQNAAGNLWEKSARTNSSNGAESIGQAPRR
jgi:hypothetical protein